MLYNLHFSLHNATLFGFCITHILNTGCATIWKKVRRQKVKEFSIENLKFYCHVYKISLLYRILKQMNTVQTSRFEWGGE